MMVHRKSLRTTLMTLTCLLGLTGAAIAQTSATATSGPNLDATPSQPPIEVDYIPPSGGPGMWNLQVDLIVDPSGGPMGKQFLSPRDANGGPILLDGEQPFPQLLWEEFLNIPVPNTAGISIIDWHEEIHTPGWEWVLPGDPRFPTLFAPNESLITKNGQPWPWDPIPMDPNDPSKLWVEFPPIEPHNMLDVHKALLWVGTAGNRIWGDDVDDAGNSVFESYIDVWEYPTIVPEPAAATLLFLGLVGMLLARRR